MNSALKSRRGTKSKLQARMPIEPGRVDWVEHLLRIALNAHERDLTSEEVQRLLPMRQEIKMLLKPAEDAFLIRANSRDSRAANAGLIQQRRLWAIYDPSAPQCMMDRRG